MLWYNIFVTCCIFLVSYFELSTQESSHIHGQNERFERVNIKDVTLFTFEAGKLTKGRKRKPLPQLIQRGEAKYREHELKSVHCVIDKDKLADPHGFMIHGEFIQESCTVQYKDASAIRNPKQYSQFALNCEGWDYEFDTHIVEGSCQLGYNIVVISEETMSVAILRFFMFAITVWYIYHHLS